MLQHFLDLEREYDMLPPEGVVLCAVSGGADSMCLLGLLTELSKERGFSLVAAHFNHGLRGAEADRDEAFVADWCGAQKIPCMIGHGDVGTQAQLLGQGVEETARQMRYAFLRRTGQETGAVRIATAHNAEDNAETLLLHLIRGTGLQGLTGIAPRRGSLVRPLLTTAREEIEAYLNVCGIPHIEDSTNTDVAYSRNRLRHEIIPLLQAGNPKIIQGLSESIRYLRADNDYLNAQAERACQAARWAEDNVVIEARVLADLPNAIAPRAARKLLEMMGDGDTDCSAAHLNAMVDLCRGEDPSALCFLPNGLLAQRVYRELLLTTQKDPTPPFAPVPLVREGVAHAAGWQITCRAVICPPEEGYSAERCYLSMVKLGKTATLRPRKQGDEIALPGRGTKTIKKLFIDEKIPRREREQIPLLADEYGTAALAGFGPDRSRLAVGGEDAWELSFTKEEIAQ